MVFLPHRGVIGKNWFFTPLQLCPRKDNESPVYEAEGNLISILLFILLHPLFPSFFYSSSLAKEETYFQNEFTFAMGISSSLKTSAVLEVRRWIVDSAVSGRVRSKENSGPPLAQMQIRKSTPFSGMQRSRGFQVMNGAGGYMGGISSPSPSTRCRCAGQELHNLEASQARFAYWSSINQSELRGRP